VIQIPVALSALSLQRLELGKPFLNSPPMLRLWWPVEVVLPVDNGTKRKRSQLWIFQVDAELEKCLLRQLALVASCCVSLVRFSGHENL
jgi:hypothetical protein